MNYKWVETVVHKQRTAQQCYYPCTHPNFAPTWPLNGDAYGIANFLDCMEVLQPLSLDFCIIICDTLLRIFQTPKAT